MKYFRVIVLLCAALALVSCGESYSRETDKLTRPEVRPPIGMPPTELVVEDWEEGPGPPAKPGDELTVKYIAVNARGKERFSSWKKGGAPFTFTLGAGKYFPGWEEGMKAMRVGGRRELLIPASLTSGLGTLYYVVDLIEIK